MIHVAGIARPDLTIGVGAHHLLRTRWRGAVEDGWERGSDPSGRGNTRGANEERKGMGIIAFIVLGLLAGVIAKGSCGVTIPAESSSLRSSESSARWSAASSQQPCSAQIRSTSSSTSHVAHGRPRGDSAARDLSHRCGSRRSRPFPAHLRVSAMGPPGAPGRPTRLRQPLSGWRHARRILLRFGAAVQRTSQTDIGTPRPQLPDLDYPRNFQRNAVAPIGAAADGR